MSRMGGYVFMIQERTNFYTDVLDVVRHNQDHPNLSKISGGDCNI